MTDKTATALLIAATLGSGLIGGLFFIFSNTIMKAFDRLPPGGAVASMQNINSVILNPLFLLVFFGTAIVCAALLILYSSQLGEPRATIACAAAFVYLLGSIVVTMAFNVPLNDRLAAVSLAANDLATQWQAYRVPWTNWNHVRTVSCLLASGLFAGALL